MPGFAARRHVSGMMSRATRSISVGIGRRLGEIGLSFPQYLVLVRLWRAWPSALVQSELAVDLAVERSSMSTLLSSLEATGLLVRHPDPDDGRRLLVGLTDEGRALEAPVLAIVDEFEEELVRDLPPGELDVLRRGLERLQARALTLRSTAPAAGRSGSRR